MSAAFLMYFGGKFKSKWGTGPSCWSMRDFVGVSDIAYLKAAVESLENGAEAGVSHALPLQCFARGLINLGLLNGIYYFN